MATTDEPDDDRLRKVTLEEQPEGGWVVTDEVTGVTTQGETTHEALENLEDALAGYYGEAGHEPTREELEAAGIDPDAAERREGSTPDWMG